MEYKDPSHNHLDEGIISGLGKAAGSAARTVGRAAVKSKGMATTAGSAVKTAAAAATKPVVSQVKKSTREFKLNAQQSMGPEGRKIARKTGGFLKNQITDPLMKLGKNALMNPNLGDEIQTRTGGFKGATNRMQDAIFGKDAMNARRSPAATPAAAAPAAAAPTGGPNPRTRDPKSDDDTDPRPGTRSPGVVSRIGGALTQSMRHDPNDPGRRFRAVKAAAGSVNRGIGGSSPQPMGSVFAGDSNSIRLRPNEPEVGNGLTPEQDAMIRRLMRTANMSHADAAAAVLSGQQGLRRQTP